MNCRYEDYSGLSQHEMAQAQKAQARVAAGPIGLIGEHPITAIIAFVTAMVVAGIFAAQDSDKRAASDDAWYRAKLECRLTGGTYEYFGTQGYHCIGGKK
jgi:hypothetical protein